MFVLRFSALSPKTQKPETVCLTYVWKFPHRRTICHSSILFYSGIYWSSQASWSVNIIMKAAKKLPKKMGRIRIHVNPWAIPWLIRQLWKVKWSICKIKHIVEACQGTINHQSIATGQVVGMEETRKVASDRQDGSQGAGHESWTVGALFFNRMLRNSNWVTWTMLHDSVNRQDLMLLFCSCQRCWQAAHPAPEGQWRRK